MSDAAFVVFEGGEGSGKSTQAQRVAERHDALLTRQPGGTGIGNAVREILLSPATEGLSVRAEALLMAADRAQHVEELIRPTLAAGRHVICDRYVGSSLAYQGAGRGLGVEAVLALSSFAVDDLWPDLTLLLDVPVEVGMARLAGDPDRLERLGAAFHEQVRACYLELAASRPERWVVIDGTGAPDEVAAAVDAALTEHLGWS